MTKDNVFFDDDYVEFGGQPFFKRPWSPSPSNDQEKNRNNVLQPNHSPNDEKGKKQLEENNYDGNMQRQQNCLSRDEKGKKIVEEEENNVGSQKDAPCSPDSDQSITEWVNELMCSDNEFEIALLNQDQHGQENDNIRGQLSGFKDQEEQNLNPEHQKFVLVQECHPKNNPPNPDGLQPKLALSLPTVDWNTLEIRSDTPDQYREQMLLGIITAIKETLQRAKDDLKYRHPLLPLPEKQIVVVQNSGSSQKIMNKTPATLAGYLPFNIVIPERCRAFGEILDQERRDAAIRRRQNDQEKEAGTNKAQKNTEKQVGNNVRQRQVSFCERLQGWTLIRKRRAAGRVDTFYHHEATQCRFRSLREVTEFVLENSTPIPSHARNRDRETQARMAQDRARGRDNLFALACGHLNAYPTSVGTGNVPNYNNTSRWSRRGQGQGYASDSSTESESEEEKRRRVSNHQNRELLQRYLHQAASSSSSSSSSSKALPSFVDRRRIDFFPSPIWWQNVRPHNNVEQNAMRPQTGVYGNIQQQAASSTSAFSARPIRRFQRRDWWNWQPRQHQQLGQAGVVQNTMLRPSTNLNLNLQWLQQASSSLSSMPTLSWPQLMKESSRMRPHNTMNMARESGSGNAIFNPRPLNQVPPPALRPPIYHEFSADPRHDPTFFNPSTTEIQELSFTPPPGPTIVNPGTTEIQEYSFTPPPGPTIFNPGTTEIQEYSFTPLPGPTIFNPWTPFHQEFPFTPRQGPFIFNPGAPIYQYQVSPATPLPGPPRMVVGQSSNNGNRSRTGTAAANLQVVDQNNNNGNDHGRRVDGQPHGQGPNEDERNAVDILATFRSWRQ